MTRLLLADRVKGQADSFLGPLMPALAQRFDIRFISAGPGPALTEAIAWADVVWLEWCWDHAVWATRSGVLGDRPCVLRLHSIEALQGDYPAQVDWSRIACLVTVGDDITEVLLQRYPAAASVARRVIANGIDLARFRAAAVAPDPFRVGWVGHIEPKKNPMLLLQIAHRLREFDPRYTFHVAGGFTDLRTRRYLDGLIPALELDQAIAFHGAVADMPSWYADKGVVLSTTMYESFGLNIGEAMACGAYPVIHSFPGADRLWPVECLFASVEQATMLIRGAEPNLYCGWVAERYGIERQTAAVLSMLDEVVAGSGLAAATPWSATYWDQRYRRGGDSGSGSAGRLARFKAETINGLVAAHGIASILEFGCGDGRQLALAAYPAYVGLDVSPEAVRRCSERFADDPSKRFALASDDPGQADLALSLDVIFHLVEDDVFDRYMARLFASAGRLVVIYASDREAQTPDLHVRHRKFSDWIACHAPQWQRIGHVANPYAFDPSAPDDTSFSDFHIYARRSAGAGVAPDPA